MNRWTDTGRTDRRTENNDALAHYYNEGKLYIYFYLGFTALPRIFHLYRADRSPKMGENRRTQGKTT